MIHHVTRTVPLDRLEAAVAFYGLLGFAELEAPPGIRGRTRWLALGPTQLHLMPSDQPAPDDGHIGVVVADYARVVDRLAGAGHPIEPRRPHWGADRAYVRDPAGRLVELIERVPQ